MKNESMKISESMSTTTSTSTASSMDEDTPSDNDVMTRSVPPSHILQDGRFIHLPPLSDAEHGQFLERSIAKHGLLTQDLKKSQAQQEEEEEEAPNDEKKDDEDSKPKVHPLAVASARLNANGIEELSKGINLAGLVSAREYFGLSNIVDPSLEFQMEKKPEKSTPKTKDETGKQAKEEEDAGLRATLIGKRKRTQFTEASTFLEKQATRLALAVTAQTVMDQRLQDLRKRWRMVAPEHGTRAKAHAVRPTEVVAMDVHTYDRDRTGTNVVKGRIARKVPRYATVELKDDYEAHVHVEEWKNKVKQAKQDDNVEMKDATSEDNEIQTRCEPFAMADPTLGKIDVDFDPDKVPMLSLELQITKASTGYCCTERLTIKGDHIPEDETVVVALQHSLFCASLFETIRKELDADTVWLSSLEEESFLPPPSQMAGSIYNGNVASLCVVHCHEGEVKVQLDSEYILTIKLVEAIKEDEVATDNVDSEQQQQQLSSGSQSPQQLQVLCRALLLHIQQVYHDFSMKASKETKQEKKAEPGLARITKQKQVESPLILQNSVGLGAKMLFEGKVRRVLTRVSNWIERQNGGHTLTVKWLASSVFDLESRFTLVFRDIVWDIELNRDEMHVTQLHKSVTFHSHQELEMYLKMEIGRSMSKR